MKSNIAVTVIETASFVKQAEELWPEAELAKAVKAGIEKKQKEGRS